MLRDRTDDGDGAVVLVLSITISRVKADAQRWFFEMSLQYNL